MCTAAAVAGAGCRATWRALADRPVLSTVDGRREPYSPGELAEAA